MRLWATIIGEPHCNFCSDKHTTIRRNTSRNEARLLTNLWARLNRGCVDFASRPLIKRHNSWKHTRTRGNECNEVAHCCSFDPLSRAARKSRLWFSSSPKQTLRKTNHMQHENTLKKTHELSTCSCISSHGRSVWRSIKTTETKSFASTTQRFQSDYRLQGLQYTLTRQIRPINSTATSVSE